MWGPEKKTENRLVRQQVKYPHWGPCFYWGPGVWGLVFLLNLSSCHILIFKLLALGGIHLKLYPFWMQALFCMWVLIWHFILTPLKRGYCNWNCLNSACSFGNRDGFFGALQLRFWTDSFRTSLSFRTDWYQIWLKLNPLWLYNGSEK